MHLVVATALVLVSIVSIYLLALLGVLVRPRWLPATFWRRLTTVLVGVSLTVILLLCSLAFLPLVLPQRSGWLAFAQVIGPYLFFGLLLIVPLAVAPRTHVLRWVLLGAVLVAVARYAPLPPLARPSVPQTALRVQVLNWNVLNTGEASQRARVRPVLLAQDAHIVVLQEAYWRWLRDDAEIRARYPYQINHTEQAESGLVLLSRYPFDEAGVAQNRPNTRGWPRLLWARLDLGNNQRLLVVAAHPESMYSSSGDCRFLSCYDTRERDALLQRARSYVDPALERGEAVLLMGDFNATEREPIYADLMQGMQDVYRATTWGLGHTWGIYEPPSSNARQMRPVVPLFRIDYIFASPQLVPLTSSVDCAPRGSDHCLLQATLALPAP